MLQLYQTLERPDVGSRSPGITDLNGHPGDGPPMNIVAPRTWGGGGGYQGAIIPARDISGVARPMIYLPIKTV